MVVYSVSATGLGIITIFGVKGRGKRVQGEGLWFGA